jgi:hypothetical protein
MGEFYGYDTRLIYLLDRLPQIYRFTRLSMVLGLRFLLYQQGESDRRF